MQEHQILRRARLVKTEEVAPDVRHFWFDIPESQSFKFIPGQFVSLTSEFNGKKVTRAYSIAARGSKENTFELCLNEVKDGIFSPYLFKMKPGDLVDMKGPHGGFVMRKPIGHSIYVATGTGIAPFLPMIEEGLAVGGDLQHTLIFGVRYDNGIMYDQSFKDLAAQYSNFKYISTVTRPSPEWKGNVGRVQQYVFAEIGDRKDVDVYICGMKEMVNDIRDRCLSLGFDKKQVVYERFD